MADIDSYIRMLGVTILSPAVLSICVLSLRAVGLDWADTSLRVTIAMFLLSGLARVLSTLNHRLVNGPPRKVIWDQEVVVITGGGSGLGLLLAEVYGLKGCSVAVIDVNETASGIVRNMGDEVRFYHCDITDPARLGEVAVRIEQDVSLL